MISALKDVMELAKKIGNIEIQQKLIEVQQQILDVQQQLTEVREENELLKKDNQRLLDASETEKNIVRHDNSFVTLSCDKSEIRYCSTCWDRDKKIIQLGRWHGGYKCGNSNCENIIGH